MSEWREWTWPTPRARFLLRYESLCFSATWPWKQWVIMYTHH